MLKLLNGLLYNCMILYILLNKLYKNLYSVHIHIQKAGATFLFVSESCCIACENKSKSPPPKLSHSESTGPSASLASGSCNRSQT